MPPASFRMFVDRARFTLVVVPLTIGVLVAPAAQATPPKTVEKFAAKSTVLQKSKSTTAVTLAGRTFRYAVGPYRIEVKFETEKRLRWTYLKAPNNQTGKSSVQTIDRTDLRGDVVLLAWTEKDGTHVTDIYDLTSMTLHVSMVFKGKRYFSKAPITEVTR